MPITCEEVCTIIDYLFHHFNDISLNNTLTDIIIDMQYRIGQLYAVAKASNQETTDSQGVEVLVNEPYEKDGEKGQYTHKIYYLGK